MEQPTCAQKANKTKKKLALHEGTSHGLKLYSIATMLNVLKFRTLYSFVFSNKILLIRAAIQIMPVRIQISKTGKTLIRLLLHKQSDLSLHCF